MTAPASPPQIGLIFQRGCADSSSGQGIGLAVVTEIVHSYGGDIQVRDESPRRRRFQMTLPDSFLAKT